MNELPSPDAEHNEEMQDVGSLRSPLRPKDPNPLPRTAPLELGHDSPEPEILPPKNPQEALEYVNRRLEEIAEEFSSGRLNRAQFTAIYKHYNDKRTIIERLIQRDPDSDAWKPVIQPGRTAFLRDHFEARPIFYVLFLHQQPRPLVTGGQQPTHATNHIAPLLKRIWSLEDRPETGLARKAIDDGQWLVMAMGRYGITFVIFSLQPSTLQSNQVRDLHADFERANQLMLDRGMIAPDRMVFPQRALIGG